MGRATLTINSRNYGAWSLRGWLLCRQSGIPFDVEELPADDPSSQAELLLLSPSFLVPCLTHDGVTVWDVLAIAEYLNELKPRSGILPTDRTARARCRAISGEVHSGFINLRTGLPMDLKASHPGFSIWGGIQADIDRIASIWHDCFARYGGTFLFGDSPSLADAMFAPVCTRFLTYDVKLDADTARYCATIMAMPAMVEWIEAARAEPDEVDDPDIEF
jgi:glutathione S-transferase